MMERGKQNQEEREEEKANNSSVCLRKLSIAMLGAYIKK